MLYHVIPGVTHQGTTAIRQWEYFILNMALIAEV